MQALESSTEELEQICSERDDLFVVERNGLKKDIDKRSIEVRAGFGKASASKSGPSSNELSSKRINLIATSVSSRQISPPFSKSWRSYRTK